MPSLNKVSLIGHLGKDPDTRYMTSGKPVSNFSVATTEYWKDKNTGQFNEKTEWHNIIAYSPLAENKVKSLKKGSLVYVEGRLQTRKWQDKSGQDKYTTEIVANELKNLSPKENKYAEKSVESEKPAEPVDDSIDDSMPF